MEYILEKVHEAKMPLQQTIPFGGVFFNDNEIFLEFLKNGEPDFFQLTHETVEQLSSSELKELLLASYTESRATLSVMA